MGKKTLGKKGYKWEENKMEEANESKEVADCKNVLPMSVEDGVKFSNGDNKKKKKKKHRVSGDDLECSADVLPTSVEDGVKLNNGDKKKRKRKMHDVSDSVAEFSADALPMSAVDGVKLSGGDKIKKKKKRHDVSVNDVEVGANQIDAVPEGDVDVSNSEKQNDQRKKRKVEFNKDKKESRKARKKDERVNNDGEVSEVTEASKETHLGVEGNVSLQKNDMKDLRNNVGLEARKDKKKSHKENKNKDGIESVSSMIDLLGDNRMEKAVKGQNNCEEDENTKMNNGEEGDLKKKRKQKGDKEGGDVVVMDRIIDGKEVGKAREQLDGNIMENVEDSRRKRKRDKKKHSDDLEAVSQEKNDSSRIVDKEYVDNEGNAHPPINEAGGRKEDVNAVNVGDGNKDKKKKKKKKKKKEKSLEEGSEGKGHKEAPRTKVNIGTADPSASPTSRRKSKKVSFSDHVEVFTSSDGPRNEKNIKEDGLVRGKRFSREEDEKIKEAVANYIEVHGLGEEGLNKVLNCASHPEIKHCWKEIGAALPWRPTQSVYYRAHIIFQRSEERTWTPEEFKLILDHYEKNGADWKSLAEVLGKHRFHVKDAWRRIKLPNMKKGHWSQDEYQNLFDLVNMDLRMKAFEEKKSKHGMLRDNICWGAISDKLATRNNALCCMKWYKQLTSSMVAEGIWADVDDYHLLMELYNLDACCMEDVDWDYLLEHRSGDVCRKRWEQMVRHIGENGNKSFAEQVEVLSKRYCPDILEAREAYDSKPAEP